MEAFDDLADPRLIDGCIYCGGPLESREHVPSRALLDDPKPDNLPIVWTCCACNNQFSKDEEYVACLIECVVAGSTDPDRMRRPQVAKMLRHSPALRARIEQSSSTVDGQVGFAVEVDRLRNVAVKLAQGHAAFELSQVCRNEPSLVECQPLEALAAESREAFETPPEVRLLGEIGSRSTQRMKVFRIELQSTTDGAKRHLEFFVNDWVEVQEDRYRYLAIDSAEGIEIRMVIGEYLACRVCWATDLEDRYRKSPRTDTK